MTGAELIEELFKLSLKELDKPVRFPSGEYLGAMREVKSVTIKPPSGAEWNSIYLLHYIERKKS
jgi:hypothetical protein